MVQLWKFWQHTGCCIRAQPSCGYKAMQFCRQSVTSRKISFAGSSLFPKSRKRKLSDELIPSGSSYLHQWLWRKKQVMDSQQQLSRHWQRDSRKEQTLSPNLTTNHRRSVKNQTPNQDWHIFGLMFLHTSWCHFASRYSIQFGKSKPVFRNVQVAWFDSWRWLHYVEGEDKVICHTCTRAHRTHQLATSMLDAAFITKGYTNWKDATRKNGLFATWKMARQCHRVAVQRSITLHATTKDVREHKLSSWAHEEDTASNRKALMKMLSNFRFLAR